VHSFHSLSLSLSLLERTATSQVRVFANKKTGILVASTRLIRTFPFPLSLRPSLCSKLHCALAVSLESTRPTRIPYPLLLLPLRFSQISIRCLSDSAYSSALSSVRLHVIVRHPPDPTQRAERTKALLDRTFLPPFSLIAPSALTVRDRLCCGTGVWKLSTIIIIKTLFFLARRLFNESSSRSFLLQHFGATFKSIVPPQTKQTNCKITLYMMPSIAMP
jgi:hypothetical protein